MYAATQASSQKIIEFDFLTLPRGELGLRVWAASVIQRAYRAAIAARKRTTATPRLTAALQSARVLA